jgi:hypothetical protein
MSAAPRLAAIVVAVLAVVGLAVVVLNLTDGGVASDPSPTPQASGAASPSPGDVPSEEPSPPDEDEILAALGEIEEQVIAIRGLPAADIGAPDLLTREEFRAELLASFEEDYPPEEVAEDNAALRALGLLEADQDIAELQLQLLGDSVLGFYDDVDKRMVIVSDEGLDALAKFTYAHEYAHAIQDAAFELASLGIDEDGQDDQAMARLAMVEGDATVTMLAWATAHLTPSELAEIASGPAPDTSGIPSWLIESLVVFPYNEGLLWAGSLAGNPISPDFADIDAAFADPPTSTEQIVNLDKWDPREEPIPVDVADIAADLGEGWTLVDDTPIGQAFLRMMLTFHGVPSDDAQAATDGWGGDRVVIATGPGENDFAVAWRLAWDSPADADEFVAAYETVVGGLGFPASVSELADGEVLVVHGSTQDILRRTSDIAGD